MVLRGKTASEQDLFEASTLFLQSIVADIGIHAAGDYCG